MIDRGEPFAIEGFSVDREVEEVERYLGQRVEEDDPFFLYYCLM